MRRHRSRDGSGLGHLLKLEGREKRTTRLTPCDDLDIVDHVASRHLFVCTNPRASGKPACGPRGGDALITAVQHQLIVRRATNVLVTACGCLGPCFDGPNAVSYPDGVWFGKLTVEDAAALADHLIDGLPFTAKIVDRPGSEPDDDR